MCIRDRPWGYRYRARLSVRLVVKKGGVLVGFHEKRSSYVADMRQCEILPPHLSAMLLPLRELIGKMSIRDRLPQFEVAVGGRVTAPSGRTRSTAQAPHSPSAQPSLAASSPCSRSQFRSVVWLSLIHI